MGSEDIAKSKATIKKAKGDVSSTLKDLFGDDKSPGKSFDYQQENSKEKMIIGPAIDEAAQYYKLPEWIGVSASPTAHRVLKIKG
jgi:hypothetical protein